MNVDFPTAVEAGTQSYILRKDGLHTVNKNHSNTTFRSEFWAFLTVCVYFVRWICVVVVVFVFVFVCISFLVCLLFCCCCCLFLFVCLFLLLFYILFSFERGLNVSCECGSVSVRSALYDITLLKF